MVENLAVPSLQSLECARCWAGLWLCNVGPLAFELPLTLLERRAQAKGDDTAWQGDVAGLWEEARDVK